MAETIQESWVGCRVACDYCLHTSIIQDGDTIDFEVYGVDDRITTEAYKLCSACDCRALLIPFQIS